MHAGMFPALHYLKIFGAVIELVAVTVMHHVLFPNLAADLFLGDIYMGEFPAAPPVPVLLIAVDDSLFLE